MEYVAKLVAAIVASARDAVSATAKTADNVREYHAEMMKRGATVDNVDKVAKALVKEARAGIVATFSKEVGAIVGAMDTEARKVAARYGSGNTEADVLLLALRTLTVRMSERKRVTVAALNGHAEALHFLNDATVPLASILDTLSDESKSARGESATDGEGSEDGEPGDTLAGLEALLTGAAKRGQWADVLAIVAKVGATVKV